MPRIAVLLGLVICCVVGSGVPAADDEKPRPQFDPVAIFKRADTNGDGKLSKEEFMALTERLPAFKDKPDLAGKLFELLDTEKHGFLTLEEFKKFPEARAQVLGLKPESEKKTTPVVAEKPATPEGIAFFEKKIRPVLVDKCYSCHSAKAEKLRGELRLDTREGTRKGGMRGPAVVPGDPKESLLIQAINHKDDLLKMPKQKLPDDVIADFETWVKMGAPDPRDDATTIVKSGIDIEKGRQYWAFQPPKKTMPPKVSDTAWARSDIDRFLLASLEAKKLKPVGDADKRTLLRRVYYDLIGLPPSPEEVEAFVNDHSKDAFEKVVDKLLASPQFGERWGRHWLDIARFGESSGKNVNFAYPHAWRYRDYVIAAFNSDKPYDQFIKEQLAGDLLHAANEKEKADHEIATGFLAIGPKDHNERSALQFQMDVADEQIDVTSQAFLGITVGCARCHDHKFDPIPQKDYYALAGIFRSSETMYGTFRILQNNHPASLIRLTPEMEQTKVGTPLTDTRKESLTKQLDDLKKERDDLFKKRDMTGVNQNQFIRINIQMATAQDQLDAYDAEGQPKQLAMGMRDRAGRGTDSRIYTRGEIDKPGDTAPRGYVQVLSKTPVTIKSGSGRLEIAEAIASKDNPLTARVMANRVWLHLFGRGLVTSPDNFGAAGQKPSHPELLDYLAVTFMDDGWSVKKLIRRLVLSRAYQLDSRYDAKNHEVDPDNSLVWRMAKKRQDAESLRDGMLAVSGQIDLTPPKGSPVYRGGGESFIGLGGGGGPGRPGGFGQQSPVTRSVYLPAIRNQTPEALALFDFPETSMVMSERPTTTIPAQGLYLLNNPWVIRQSETAAGKLLEKEASDAERIKQGYLRFFGRTPSEKESKAALDFLDRYEKSATGAAKRRAAWSALCQAWFASAEFLYVN
jgi:hypothetical protein